MLVVAEAAGARGAAPSWLDERTFSVSEGLAAAKTEGSAGVSGRARGRCERRRREHFRYFQITRYPGAKEASIVPAQSVVFDAETGEVSLPVRPKVARVRPRCTDCEGRGRTRRRCRDCAQLRRRLRRPVESGNAESEERAVRRAQSMIRRYCRECGLDHMWTFTYAGEGCHDRHEVLAHMEAFGREWAVRFKTRRYPDGRPWLAVLELHPGGHGWHVHFCIRGYLHWSKLAPLWPHGSIQIPEGPDGQKLAGWFDPQYVARYLSDYVGKTLGDGREHLGEHRYLKARVMRLTTERHLAAGYESAERVAIALFGGVPPAFRWDSEDDEDWTGPPVTWLDWWVIDKDGRRRRGRETDGT